MMLCSNGSDVTADDCYTVEYCVENGVKRSVHPSLASRARAVLSLLGMMAEERWKKNS